MAISCAIFFIAGVSSGIFCDHFTNHKIFSAASFKALFAFLAGDILMKQKDKGKYWISVVGMKFGGKSWRPSVNVYIGNSDAATVRPNKVTANTRLSFLDLNTLHNNGSAVVVVANMKTHCWPGPCVTNQNTRSTSFTRSTNSMSCMTPLDLLAVPYLICPLGIRILHFNIKHNAHPTGPFLIALGDRTGSSFSIT